MDDKKEGGRGKGSLTLSRRSPEKEKKHPANILHRGRGGTSVAAPLLSIEREKRKKGKGKER